MTEFPGKNETVIPSAPADGVVLLTLDRPAKRNALNNQVLGEITALLDHLSGDGATRAVVITGGAEVFAAGADLGEMASLDAVGILHDPRVELWRRLAACPLPLIAAVNGYALGAGCELAMHADIIVAGETATFGQPEINLGIIPGAGGTQRLIRTVGKSLAMKMVLSGERITASEALRAGLVAEITAPAETIARAVALAATIATKPPVAVREAKRVLLNGFETHLGAGIDFERKTFAVLAATEDRNEGIRAFLDKRKPVFKGR